MTDAPPSAPPPARGGGIAWERERSFVALKETLLGVLLQPVATFRAARPVASLLPALGFVLIFGGLTYGLHVGLDFVLRHFTGDMILGRPFPLVMPSWALFVFPISLTGGVLINAALLHLALMVTGANPLRFGVSFRISAYATGATSFFGVVPVVGHWAGMLALFLVEVAAIQSMHRTTVGKAAFAAIVPIILRFAFYATVALAVINAIASLFE